MFYWKNADTGNVIESEVEPLGEWIEIDQDEYEALAHPLTQTAREQSVVRTPPKSMCSCFGWDTDPFCPVHGE